ncbi:MAG: hypothetical protein HYV63_11155 [Candidatus Schekmanbacteria bacterium]|nr:hypothetical protein [Candidatus Schekmanbacteria bacterium]
MAASANPLQNPDPVFHPNDHDNEAPDIAAIMRQIRSELPEAEPTEVGLPERPGRRPLGSPDDDGEGDRILWEEHGHLRQTYSLGLRDGDEDILLRSLYTLNDTYLVFDEQRPAHFATPPCAPRGGLLARVRRRARQWILNCIGEDLREVEETLRVSLVRQVHFNATQVRLQNDLWNKIETQRRFNEAATRFCQDVILRLHSHICTALEHAELIRDLYDRADRLFVLGNLAQITEEELLQVRRDLDAAGEQMNELQRALSALELAAKSWARAGTEM